MEERLTKFINKKHRLLPGFNLTLGVATTYLGLVVILPLSTLILKTAQMGWGDFVNTVMAPRALAAYKLSLITSLVSAMVNAVFGLLVAWVLVRYQFFGKKIIDACMDIPFALPTAVAGIALCATYSSNGILGSYLYAWGIQSAFSPLGIIIALTFIGMPFVVRTVEPVLKDLDKELEEVAASLGANRAQIIWKVIFPTLLPAWITGFTLAFARALGEYGSIAFISGNMPMKTEIAPLLIMTKLEQYDYAGATAIALVMLGGSFVLLLFINGLQQWKQRRTFNE